MNLELLQSFGQNYPEEADGFLDCGGAALCCKFNRWGSLLAVGCNDGRVCIYDFITRQLARVIMAHVQPVTSLSWTRTGRRLLTCSSDHVVCVWNVLNSELVFQLRFATAVLKVQFHPRNHDQFLVCIVKEEAVLVDIKGTDGHLQRVIPSDDEQCVDLHVTACFDRRGLHIITGSTRGKFTVFKADSLVRVASFRLQSNHAIKTLDFARRASYFVACSADRIIRVYDLREALVRGNTSCAEPVQKLQDMVNKTPWKTCCLSGAGDYLCAGSNKSHTLYIWEREHGNLVKILHGNKGESLLDVQWHPARPVICSVANGVVCVWSQCHVENWSAFAPDFRELDDNVEYEERESEFDECDSDKSVSDDTEVAVDDQLVDVTHIHAGDMFQSSDEEELQQESCYDPRDERAPLWYLPCAPDIDQPEETSLQTQTNVEVDVTGLGATSPNKRSHKQRASNENDDLFVAPSSQRRQRQGSNSASVGRPAHKQRRTISRN